MTTPTAQELLLVLESHPDILFELLQGALVHPPKIAGAWQHDSGLGGFYRPTLGEILMRVVLSDDGMWEYRYRFEEPVRVSYADDLSRECADNYLLDRGWTLLHADGTWTPPRRDLEVEERAERGMVLA